MAEVNTKTYATTVSLEVKGTNGDLGFLPTELPATLPIEFYTSSTVREPASVNISKAGFSTALAGDWNKINFYSNSAANINTSTSLHTLSASIKIANYNKSMKVTDTRYPSWIPEGDALVTTGVLYVSDSTAAPEPEPVADPEATGGTVTNITEGGVGYRVHTFTSSGTFEVVSGITGVEYLVVAGGGGGGGGYASGGGGAGGLLTRTGYTVTSSTPYTVTVGGGGAGTSNRTGYGTNGNNSTFGTGSAVYTAATSGLITSYGGGGGGSDQTNAGASGGSGGGSAGDAGSGTGGSGTTAQGFAGGNMPNAGPNYGGGGGGGAGSAGANGTGSAGGNGGSGVASSISGTSVTYAGGGGAGTYNGGTAGTGTGGGGNAGTWSGTAPTNGTPNTGGGGGGISQLGTGGSGGSGIVIIRYPAAAQAVVEPGFGPVATNFIDTFSGTKKYIDITNGSDSNNGDTDAAAYQTLAYAQAQTAAINTAVMYVINPGVYTLTPTVISPGYSSVGISDGNLPRTFFCAAGQVVFQWTATSGDRDAAMTSLRNPNSAVYGAILKRNHNGKTTNYSTAMLNGASAYPLKGDFYNCVFQETNANGDWSLQYDNDQLNQSTVNNCSFYTAENGQADYSGGPGLVLNNCAFRYVWGTSASTRNNTISAQTMDATTYELATNNSTHGVYSGTYAWGTDMWGLQPTGTQVEYLVVAGGGGGGGNYQGGGGGAGGLLQGSNYAIAGATYTVTVGGGGAGGAGGASPNTGDAGASGFNSVFNNITAIGGGGGGSYYASVTNTSGTGNGKGRDGGSGGGASPGPGQNSRGGSAVIGQGNNGGDANEASPYMAGGGGGAGTAGSGGTGHGTQTGNGGDGLVSNITGASVTYAGGGGGSKYLSFPVGLGGAGGGGQGSDGSVAPSAGATNLGGGGGGTERNGSFKTGGAGGSGVVILKYPDTLDLTIGAGLTSTTDSSTAAGYKITTFTAGTGNVQFSEAELGTYSSSIAERVGIAAPTTSAPTDFFSVSIASLKVTKAITDSYIGRPINAYISSTDNISNTREIIIDRSKTIKAVRNIGAFSSSYSKSVKIPLNVTDLSATVGVFIKNGITIFETITDENNPTILDVIEVDTGTGTGATRQILIK